MNQEDKTTRAIFSKDDTQIVKGIAVIMMIIHHFISNNPGLPVTLSFDNRKMVIATACKVCVSIFMVLSGYGIMKSWQHTWHHHSHEASEKKKVLLYCKFVYNHIVKLLFSFWLIYLMCMLLFLMRGGVLKNLYGSGRQGVLYLMKDFFGLYNLYEVTPTLVGAWWFMEAIFVCYFLFPVMNLILEKGKIIGAIVLALGTYSPWILYQIRQGFDWHTDRELFYLFSFVLGMICAEYDLFSMFVRYSKVLPVKGLALIVMTGMFVIRCRYCLIVDSFFAVTVIFVSVCFFSRIPYVSELLKSFGECSSDIYMFHISILSIMSGVSFVNDKCKVAVIIFFCWSVGLAVAKLKATVHYQQLVNRCLIKDRKEVKHG